MAEFQTSFIPKKSFDAGAAKRAPKGGLVFFVSVIAFILSAVLAGGAFGYQKFLEASLTNKKDTLEKARAAFEPDLIRQLSHLDAKLKSARTLLDSHLALSSFFDLLETITLESIRFKSFAYAQDDKGVHVTMQGEALSYAAVALQSDEFAKQKLLHQPVFSGLGLDEKGNVVFTVTALLDPSLVSYKERVAQGGTALFTPSDASAPQVAGVSTTTFN